MEREFVPYDLYIEIKKLGFDEKCLSYSVSTKDVSGRTWTSVLSAPLYQQAFRFFREKYNLHFCLKANYDILDSYIFYINGKEIKRFTIKNTKWESLEKTASFKKSRCYKTYTYEEAELECLKKLIEIVKNK
jgi:hypothetical protein